MAKRFHLFITLELRQTLNAMYIRFSAKYAKQSISRGCLLESLTQTVSNSFLVIVDSGNPFITLLGKIADNINRLFDPSAVLVEGSPSKKAIPYHNNQVLTVLIAMRLFQNLVSY